jgi:hypothetical protein
MDDYFIKSHFDIYGRTESHRTADKGHACWRIFGTGWKKTLKRCMLHHGYIDISPWLHGAW